MINPLEYMSSFSPHDGLVINMPSVTTIAIDDRDDVDTTRRLEQISRWHRRFLRPAREVILSGARPDVDGVDWVKLNPWSGHYRKKYSQWCQYELKNHFSTKFVIIWQHDGFAIEPVRWTPEFLEYDYIGSPWHGVRSGPVGVVGNGGFSLRTKRFCEEVSRLEDCGDMPEDYHFCVTSRSILEKGGMRFAHTELAERWCSEVRIGHCFGFHNRRLFQLVYTKVNQLVAHKTSRF